MSNAILRHGEPFA